MRLTRELSSEGEQNKMDANVRRFGIAVAKAKTYYERWMEKEGIPIVEGFGVTDV